MPSLLESGPINFHQTRFRVRLLRKLNRSTNLLMQEAGKIRYQPSKKNQIFHVEIIDENFYRFSSLVNKSRYTIPVIGPTTAQKVNYFPHQYCNLMQCVTF